jgi:hypothetical protein
VKILDRMVGGFVAVEMSELFFRWYEPCHMVSSSASKGFNENLKRFLAHIVRTKF